MHVRRCMKPDNFGNKLVDISLHHFSDGSELGYGQCSSFRMVIETGKVHCSLLLGKWRGVPKKFISIPRLEVNAAALSVKMACLLKKELKPGEIKKQFWTSSKVVRGCIKRDVSRRFRKTVANNVIGIYYDIVVYSNLFKGTILFRIFKSIKNTLKQTSPVVNKFRLRVIHL